MKLWFAKAGEAKITEVECNCSWVFFDTGRFETWNEAQGQRAGF